MDTVRRYRMLIGGDWVDADERFEIRSPATEEPVASVAKGGLEHADRAVAAARAASSGRTRLMSTPRRSSCTSTCLAGWTAGPIRCCSAPRRPEHRR